MSFGSCPSQSDVEQPPRFSFGLWGLLEELRDTSLIQPEHEYNVEFKSLATVERQES